MKIIDLKTTEKFVVYLLDQIEKHKEDWYIENQEMQSTNNELRHFKALVEKSPLVPMDIKKKIADINFTFDEIKHSRKQFFRNFFTIWQRNIFSNSAEETDSDKFKLKLEKLRVDLINIKRMINLHK
ncbi:MAG: hypothetical protein D8M58_12775 [Calditrichaeota bacterium]|nr:MAG: hypothetical protein DWQ03_13560 [Calditrichota bacterium]MBL1206272.1 hypothetical protein [Calditrichota bacterium]NOG46098.1 hypothetical protein [Calditrichota bacterium]